MPSFPAANYISDNARTKGQVKTAFEDWLAKCKAMLGGAVLTEFTIASGSITPTVAVFTVDTEANAASDDLTNVVTSSHDAGSIVKFRNEDGARVVTIKNNAGGAGQIFTRTGADVVLSGTTMFFEMIRVGTDWYEISREIQATESVLGIAKKASQAIVDALVNTTDFVSPATLAKHTPVGIRHQTLPAQAWEASPTNGAGLSKTYLGTNGIALGTEWDFDTAVAERVTIKQSIPKGVNPAAGFKFRVRWRATSSSGGVAWGMKALALRDASTMDQAMSAQVVVTDTLLATTQAQVTAWSGTVTPSGTVAAEDFIIFDLERVVSNGSDTLGADAKMLEVELEWTQTKGTDS